MSNKNLSSEEQKMLKEYARHLKPIWQMAKEKARVPGYVLIAEGKKEVDGSPIQPMAIYVKEKSFQVEVNHYRRLRHAWLKNGQEGIENYLVWYKKIIDNANIKERVDA